MTMPHTMAKMLDELDKFAFPEPAKIPDAGRENFQVLAITGRVRDLVDHLGQPESTLVMGHCYLSPVVTRFVEGLPFPDTLVAFGVDPKEFWKRGAYVIPELGKPPDFVLEVASESTVKADLEDRPLDYARLGVGEYWRFDRTGEHYGARLAGDRLVAGHYEPIPIDTISYDVHQGYSSALSLDLRWNHGELLFFSPTASRPIPSLASERQGRLEAEARVRELEELLRSQDRRLPDDFP